ncbi:hypothetical protein [Acidaminococcus intestini]|nr:hypothetical protein [Acidaminococcus intestini]
MICSHCGLEYPNHLAECPNCHTPNDDIAAEVLTEDEGSIIYFGALK